MIDFFEKRTAAHINTVNYLAGLLGHSFPNHDQSKFLEPERTPYIVMTHIRANPPIPKGYKGLEIMNAIKHHYACNPHHPEYYQNLADMPTFRLEEMVCDWAAVQCEINLLDYDFKEPSSTWSYYQNRVLKKYDFLSHQKPIIEQAIAALDFDVRDNPEIHKIWKGFLTR